MRLLILGATGRLGKWVLLEALRREHTAHVLVRDKSRLDSQSDRLSIFEGSPTDRADLDRAMQNCEAIINTLNISRKSDFPWAPLRTPKTFLSDTLSLILELADRHKIRRLLVTTAWGVGDSRQELPGWFTWLIDHSNIRFAYQQHERQEEMLRQSRMDWTIIRPAGLTNGNKGQSIKISYQGTSKLNLTIHRRAVANFMLDILQDRSFYGKIPAISSG